MKDEKINDWMESIIWDGSQTTYEKIVDMCPDWQEVSRKDEVLTIFNCMNKREITVDFRDIVIFEDGVLDKLRLIISMEKYDMVEE
ncbi:TPA: hypothetical protein ACGO1T_001765 [Streptococcus suis]